MSDSEVVERLDRLIEILSTVDHTIEQKEVFNGTYVEQSLEGIGKSLEEINTKLDELKGIGDLLSTIEDHTDWTTHYSKEMLKKLKE